MRSRSRILVMSLLGGLVIAAVTTAVTARPHEARAGGVTLGESAGFSPGAPILSESDADLVRDLDAMAATGARWLRIDFDWPSIEPSPGAFSWGATDRVVHAAQTRGLSIIALPAYTPAWARPPGTTDKYPPSQPADYAAFVRSAALRFAPTGLKVWEVWNEPNSSSFWQPRPNPAAYAALLREAAAAVRGVDPSTTVLTGGLSPGVDAADGSQISPVSFLRRLYAAQGGASFDAVGIHPYSYPALPLDPSSAAWNTLLRLPLLRAVMVANGDEAKKVWATEFGAPTAGPGAISEERQVEMVTAGYAAFGAWSWTGPMLWYSLRDEGSDPGDREDHFGLIRRDFTPKPALAAFTAMISPRPGPPSTGPDMSGTRQGRRSWCTPDQAAPQMTASSAAPPTMGGATGRVGGVLVPGNPCLSSMLDSTG